MVRCEIVIVTLIVSSKGYCKYLVLSFKSSV